MPEMKILRLLPALLLPLAACKNDNSHGNVPSHHNELLSSQAHIEKQIEDLASANALVIKKLDDLAAEVAVVRKIAEGFAEDDAAEEAALKAASKKR